MAFTETFGGTTIYPSDVSYRAISLSANQTLAWPLEVATSGNVVAQIMDVTPSAGGFTITMPPANEASPGETALFFNAGSFNFTVADNAGNTIVAITPGLAYQIYLRTNTTAAGQWRTTQFGAGTSSATAGSLVGAGIKAINTTLNQSMAVTSLSVNYTAGAADRSAAFLWTGGAGTITLPAASTVGNDWFFHIRNGGTGAISLATTGGELINGTATVDFNPGDSAIIVCDGTGYFTIGFGQAPEFLFDYVSIDLTSQSSPYTLAGSNLNRIAYQFSGTLTTNMQIIVPATIQQYWVGNFTTGGSYTLTVKTSAGTGVVVPRDARAILYCNGTNVVTADTGGISIPILVSQGGTGATNASSARTNLGATSIGNALFIAVDEATARNAIIAAKSGANSDITSLTGLTTPLSVPQGGTGVATFTANGIVYGSGASALAVTVAGTTGQVLVGNTGTAPSWSTLSGIGVTSFSAGSTGLTPSTATTGIVTLAGTLIVANGGTGATTLTGYVKGSGTSALTASATIPATDISGGAALTKTDDTNVTLTLGGTPASALLAATSLTLGWSGQLSVARGGTGQSSYTDGQLLIGNSTGNTLTKATLTAGTNVSITNGSGAITINATDQYVGTVTSVSGTGTVSGLTLTGTVTTSGNLTLGGTLAVTASDFASQTAKTFLAAPNASAGVPSFRAIIPADVPTLNQNTTGTASNVTGTVAVANGGTGTATAFTAGSVVFAGASGVYSQDNANLFWDDTNNWLGIGTSTPDIFGRFYTRSVGINSSGTSMLQINGTTYGGIDLGFNGTRTATMLAETGGFYLQTNTAAAMSLGTNGTERMRIDSSGNVGIGTSSPGAKLEVAGGDLRVNGTGTGNIGITLKRTAGTTSDWYQYIPSGSDAFVWFQGGVGAERMRITSAGDVGIGTSSPAQRLTIGGTGGAPAGSNIDLTGYNSFAHALMLSSAGSSAVDFIVGTSSAIPLILNTNGTERMRIDSSGNVGIGTSSPSTKLQVNGGVAINGATFPSSGVGMELIWDGTQSVVQSYSRNVAAYQPLWLDGSLLRFNTNGTEKARITSAGDVGIGTSSPGSYAKAAVLNTTGSNAFYAGSATQGVYISHSTGVDVVYNASGSSVGQHVWQTGNTERMRLDTSGNFMVAKSAVQVGAVGAELRTDGGSTFTRSGSTNATSTLEVYSTGAAAFRFFVDMAGNVNAVNTSISAISDIRLKENVRDLDTGLDTILALKPRRFDWKEGKGKDVKDDMGFIAQEVEEVLPALIGGWKAGEGEPDDLKSLRAGDLIPVLVKAIQELTARVAQLEGN